MMNIIEYQEPKPTIWQKCKNFGQNCKTFAKNTAISLTTGVSVLASNATYAAIDVSSVVTEINDNKTGMSSIGLAMLALAAFIVGYFMLRRMMR